MKKYIFASCKNWHLRIFNKLSDAMPEAWVYVSNTNELENQLLSFNPRYIFFLHWNWLVNEHVWQSHECVCFHMTDVPYGRGGSPLQNLILAGHKQTKLTALKMIKNMDAGPIYTKKTLKLDGSAQEIYIKAGELSAEMIKWIIENEPNPFPQQGEVVLFKRRSPEQSVLPKIATLPQIYDFIRMLDAESYPKAFIDYGEFLLNLSKAKFKNGRLTAKVEIKCKNETKVNTK